MPSFYPRGVSDVAQASGNARFRAERATTSPEETAWVVVDADWNLHLEACAHLASLRATDRSSNTERVYAGRVALFLNYCELSGVDWHDPEFLELHAFLRWLITQPVRRPGGSARLRSKGTANAIVTTTCEFLKFGAKLGWVAASVPGLLSQPKYLRVKTMTYRSTLHKEPGYLMDYLGRVLRGWANF